MTPTEYAFACLLALVIFGWLTSNDRLRQQRDHWFIRAGRLRRQCKRLRRQRDAAYQQVLNECHAHAETKARVADLEADLIQAGSEAATHANHLEALIDATSEKPLSLVKGGRS